MDKNYLEIFIPADNDTYIDLDIELSFRGKLISASGKNVDITDLTAVSNNFLHYLFSQCNVTLNEVTARRRASIIIIAHISRLS